MDQVILQLLPPLLALSIHVIVGRSRQPVPVGTRRRHLR
jgi:hypothetical protein